MGGLIVVQHQINGVRGRADEDDLKDGIVERFGFVKGPEQVDVPGDVDNQIEQLRFEGDARCALPCVRRFPEL